MRRLDRMDAYLLSWVVHVIAFAVVFRPAYQPWPSAIPADVLIAVTLGVLPWIAHRAWLLAVGLRQGRRSSVQPD